MQVEEGTSLAELCLKFSSLMLAAQRLWRAGMDKASHLKKLGNEQDRLILSDDDFKLVNQTTKNLTLSMPCHNPWLEDRFIIVGYITL